MLRALEEATPVGEDKRKYFKVAGGTELLKCGTKEAAENLFDDLERYGYFIVRKGEVESWLPCLDVPRSKQKTGEQSWRANIFAAMGNHPRSEKYAGPESGDVWDFVGRAKGWLTNAHRKGIPTNVE